ncbi:MAG: hypothetical protein COW30_18215 [Rhodospirillales bacterium CG15_BIG_FIL_POST_REV_8_21_14_020_66_15]|nr:MAG: hypothetical protein COW30_18215 [Rhodospirillales bacterium CG15_BIG_FIL_POST_REV_8_21_14_020_66_15]
MPSDSDDQFDKADMILSDALQEFIKAGVSQEVYGMALLEIGVLAMVRLDESEDRIVGLVRDFIARAHQGMPPSPAPGQ